MLAYTICFCRSGDRLLLLHRRRPPNAGLWNGVGGKLAPGEHPTDCIRREVLEEAGIDLATAGTLRFGGIVTWTVGADPTMPSSGMYAFVADLDPAYPTWDGDRDIPEGLLRWHPLAWATDLTNTVLVSNLPHFVPPMLAGDPPMEYRCTYSDTLMSSQLISVMRHPLTCGDALS
jgi:8-oxo-dGTP diphosphatase